MTDHLITAIAGTALALTAAAVAAVATRVRLLPEVIDVSIILTGAGLGSLLGAFYGALRGYHPDRLARVSLGFSLLCGSLTAAGFLVVLLAELL